MILSSWNIIGLNKPFKQKELINFLLKNKVDMIGCLETKVKANNVKKVIRRLGNEWKFYTDYSQAPNGRICVGWKQRDVTVIILEFTTQLVHCQVEDRSSQFKCKISFVYGFNTIAARKTLWDTLRLTGRNMDDPWVVLGDLNTVLYADDRINGIPVHLTKTVDFQSCVTNVGLGQITRRGWQYSWSNKRDSPDRIYSHIDWAFGNDKWFQYYGSLEATYHNLGYSDHTSITIITGVSRHKLKKLFRLLNVPLSKDAFKEDVKECWLQRITGYSMYVIWRKLKSYSQQYE
ncbi:uncharacterized protein [Nicotiana tomentosiformis]|uniref:uncharacterized protein n=1 Tax=Nicotiana tomentosiformis TaxID=4098 RepID=UPI00388C5BCF